MLYYIPFTYKEFQSGGSNEVNAKLIVDLPELALADARRNLLVRDLVREAHISAGHRGNPNYDAQPESILDVYNGTDLDKSISIRVEYRRDPAMDWTYWQSFVFYISLITDGDPKYIPFRELVFVCRNEFPIYREAFILDLMVRGTVIKMATYQQDDILKVYTGAHYEVAKVDLSNGKMMANMIGSNTGNIEIKPLTYPFVKSIDVTPDLLNIVGAQWVCGDLYGKQECWYELYLNTGASSTVIKLISYLRKQYIVVEDSTAACGYRLVEFYGLDGLQDAIRKEYGINYVPSKIIEIEQYISWLYHWLYIIIDLPTTVDAYGINADYKTVLTDVMNKYQISRNIAEHYLSGYQLRNYFI